MLNNGPLSSRDIVGDLFASQTIGIGSWYTIVFAILVAFAIGLFIYWVYRKNYRGVMYSGSFGLTLVLMTVITTPVVMCIKSSIQLSMGMVGALSIVRFRTAVKDPLDTAYMFWALTMGILLGAGQFFMAVLASACIALVIFLTSRMRLKKDDSFLLVVRYAQSAEGMVSGLLRTIRNQHVKSKLATQSGVELTVEMRAVRQDALLGKLMAMEGVKDASIIAYQDDSI